jgi:hypothetical protein
MLIANPIYDAVFKYLMQDTHSAKILLQAILELPILDLEFSTQEFASEIQHFSIFRVDFKARIKTRDNQEKLILIELQKIKFSTDDVFRFRKYLGEQYVSRNNIDEEGKPLPLVTIYILGHYLEEYQDYPIIRVKRQILEHGTSKVLESGKSRFIESLTHDCIIIQIPSLKKKQNKTDELERLMDIFDLARRHQIEYDEKGLPEEYFPLLRRLRKAIEEEEVKGIMDVEDEIIESFKQKELEIEKALEIAEKERKRAEAEKKRAEEKEKLLEEEKKRAEAERLKLIETARFLKTLNIDIEVIANKTGLSKQEIENL